MRFIVLGSSGFVGGRIEKYLQSKNHEVLALRRPEFDILDFNTYKRIEFSNSIIIDCVTSIDSAENEADTIIYQSFKKLIDYLRATNVNFTYIYISTIATLIPESVASSHYVRAKFRAEKYLRSVDLNYKIIRLIFPFGEGERENRLISRIIKKLAKNENVTIDDLTFNLTPIQSLLKIFLQLVNSDEKEINFSDGVLYSLIDIVEYIRKELNSTGKIKLTGKQLNFTASRYPQTTNGMKTVFHNLKKMCNDEKR